jgi:uracil-DNA glycosylase family 4
MASKKIKLDDLKQQILEDDPSPELRKGATQLVFGDGNPEAELVFIGEAPGKNEDIQGIPFVGAAGKFLNEMLAMVGLDRHDIYITNIVKYRPPNNRDPLPQEKQIFMKYLESQLEVIQPVLTVTLGRHSLNCFLPDLSISACHGKPKRYKSRVYLPLFHPAAALYNGAMRQTLIDDFALIPAILQKIKAS